MLGGANELQLRLYSDVDHAGCRDTRRSTTGIVVQHGGSVFTNSTRQTLISSSSTDAEYIALHQTIKQGFTAQMLLQELGRDVTTTITIHTDNVNAIKYEEDRSPRSKFVDTYYKLVRERVATGDINLTYTPTTEMVADGLTKALGQEKFDKFKTMLGMATSTTTTSTTTT